MKSIITILMILFPYPVFAMSLGIVINAPEGIVLAAESRVTLTATPADGSPTIHVNFDNATKLLSFSRPNKAVGAVTFGLGAIGIRTAQSFLSEFESTLPTERLSVKEFGTKLGEFYKKQWDATKKVQSKMQGGMHFIVAGFDEGAPYGETYELIIPNNPVPIIRHDVNAFGITWGGQREVVDRIVQGYDSKLLDTVKMTLNLDDTQAQHLQTELRKYELPVPVQAMPLQDCVNLAIFMIRTTIEAQHLTVGLRGCSGPIDVATITRQDGISFVQRKSITGDQSP